MPQADADVAGLPAGSVRVDVPMPHHAANQLRVALLYSGRFFGPSLSAHIVDNHLENIIRPNSASVFVTVDPTTWCTAPAAARHAYRSGDRWAAESHLRAQVRATFRRWPKLYVSLCSSEEPAIPHLYGMAGIKAMSKMNQTGHRAAIFIHKWYMQFDHYAKAEALRQAYGPHDLVVRVRMDVEIERPVLLERARGERTSSAYIIYVRAVNGSKLFVQRLHSDGGASGASGGRLEEVGSFGSYSIDPLGISPTSNRHCLPDGWDPNLYSSQDGMPACSAINPAGRDVQWIWSDWLFVGTASSLAPLAAMTARGFVLGHQHQRCLGLCQEEQTALHLKHAGVSLRRLTLPIRMHKMTFNPCGSTPLLNFSELLTQHQISSWYAPCPPSERGCAARAHRAGVEVPDKALGYDEQDVTPL